MNKYSVTIGLEIHAELKTASKMFCSCLNPASLASRSSSVEAGRSGPSASQGGNPFSSEANTNICPICLGMPGTLPVLNKQAIDWTIKTGLALNCKIANITKWDRKNYFYPDLPKGYQISQYDLPICHDGHIEISNDQFLISKQASKPKTPKTKTIRITRIHLEEDTGTLKHPEGRAEVDYSLADYNRAGAPLMELVTEPDIESSGEAKSFCQNYQQILKTLEVSDADMEKGQMRCEANISVRKISNLKSQISKLGTKVEVKNLNSFKAVEKAINYEIERQVEVVEAGGKIVQETRGWDDKKCKTYIMRIKETSADYRYFPEPDIPPVALSREQINQLKAQLPELPDQKVERYIKKYHLTSDEAKIIAQSPVFSAFLEENIKFTKNIKEVAVWIINEPTFLHLLVKTSASLVDAIKSGQISNALAKSILPELLHQKELSVVLKNKRLKFLNNENELETIAEQILEENADVVEKIKNGKKEALGFLVGQIMRQTRGQADPKLVNNILEKKIRRKSV